MSAKSEPLPPVDVSSLSEEDALRANEEAAFARQGAQLDRGLRKYAGYGALSVAAVLYVTGVCLAIEFSKPSPVGIPGPSWHVVAATLAALFTVPTVLLLAVLRSTSRPAKDAEADSLHAAIGTKVMSLLDKLIDGVVKP